MCLFIEFANPDHIPSILERDLTDKDLRRGWARLILKIYKVDPLICLKCQGMMRVIAFIDDKVVIRKILTHLNLWDVKGNHDFLGTRRKTVDIWVMVADNMYMIITHYREKLINAIVYFAAQTKHCGKTKLLKLLYFLDFSHFKQTGKSVTGLAYHAWKMGPVPKDLFEELSANMKPDMKAAIHDLPDTEGFQQIRPKRKFDGQYFSNKEMKLLEDISFVFQDAKADAMVESTHLKNEPWDRTLKEKGEFKKIDYMLAIDSDIVSLSCDEVMERMEERSEMVEIFGAD